MAEQFDPYHVWLGIPPHEQPPNHYRLLSIPQFSSNPDVIESAADRQMAHLRTFQIGERSDLSQKLLNEVSAARVCLFNQQQKAAYDQELRKQMLPPEAEAADVSETDDVSETSDVIVRTGTKATARQPNRSAARPGVILGVVALVIVLVAAVLFINRTPSQTPIAKTPPPVPAGPTPPKNKLNYLVLSVNQAGSTAEIDDLRVVDLKTNRVFYQNNFDGGKTEHLSLLFRRNDNSPEGKRWHDDPTKTRIVDGRLRLECEGFRRNGAGAYESHATMILKQKLPDDFSIEFSVKKLQWSGHFFFDIISEPRIGSLARASLRYSGSKITEAKAFHHKEVAINLNAPTGKVVHYKLIKRGSELTFQINGTKVAQFSEER